MMFGIAPCAGHTGSNPIAARLEPGMNPSSLAIEAKIVGGRLIVPDKARLVDQIRTLPDGPVVLRIERQTRSQAQNRLYWKLLGELSEHTGYTAEELHAECKRRFNARTVCDVDPNTGEIIDDTGGRSTTTLTVPQFTEYIDRVTRWAAEQFGVVVRD